MLRCHVKKGPGKGAARYLRKPAKQTELVENKFVLGNETFYFAFRSIKGA